MQPTPSPAATAQASPLARLADFGQSVWLDFIQRSLVASGELARKIEQDGLAGVTSNPAIFRQAIAGTGDYAADLERAAKELPIDSKAIYERIAVHDVQLACDALRVVFERTLRRDGYVSLEVSPHLAHDAQGTIEEARRLWRAVGRENLMVKVPGTPAGTPAVRALVSEGINVNVTLLFGLGPYLRVAEAYVAGLEDLDARGGDVSTVASVASFFVSRIDSLVDPLLARLAREASTPALSTLAQSLTGRIAVANAKVAYKAYERTIAGPRWEALSKKGAMTQRLLWASTSTKNPAYGDVVYADELIGADTVNTLPPATYEAFRDHGAPRASLTEKVEDAEEALRLLARAGVSLNECAEKLLEQGVRLFAEAFDELLAAISARVVPLAGAGALTASLPAALGAAVGAAREDWRAGDKVRRLWARDAALWTGGDEARWLGWLDNVAREQALVPQYSAFAEEVRRDGFTHVLLCGMGGSSLCPEVWKRTFGRVAGSPELFVIDSTDPRQVAAAEEGLDLARTLVIVASKSGGTLEPNILKQHFFDRIEKVAGAGRAGRQFVAITDPGSHMQAVAEQDGFRRVFFGEPSIGGRYSALSAFGLVPAAAMGLDVAKLLERAAAMARACGASVDPGRNPGVALGLVLGEAARAGRDKLTIVASSGVRWLGAWLEQLLAESTGKAGRGIIPVDAEPLGAPESYGADRLFAHLRLAQDADEANAKALAAIERAGHPVVRIVMQDACDLAAEFFRWEIATAVAGERLAVHPFDQPDVEASKVETRKLTSAYEESGSLPPEKPVLEREGVKLFADERNAKALAKAAGPKPTLASWLAAHFARAKAGDYVALLAYLAMNDAHEATLQEMRLLLRERTKCATCLGFGPRFLHSTGQAYKGGPNTGVFLQITGDDARDLGVPGAKYTFGVVKAAQARGDLAVLAERGRRVLRAHLGPDTEQGLATLHGALRKALG